MQIRTKIQHAWATAVETMGTFINWSLKASEGPEEILNWFKLVSSAFAYIENTQLIPNYEHLTENETFIKVIEDYKRFTISEKLRAFTVAADHIKKNNFKNQFFLIVLDLKENRVRVIPFEEEQIEEANKTYTEFEMSLKEGDNKQAVLVSIDNIDSLKKAYPNYFLDTREFIGYIDNIGKKVQKIEAAAETK